MDDCTSAIWTCVTVSLALTYHYIKNKTKCSEHSEKKHENSWSYKDALQKESLVFVFFM